MVILLIDVDNVDKHKTVENELIKKNIEYQYSYELREYEYERPVLIVDGVPLDMARAMKWIKECYND